VAKIVEVSPSSFADTTALSNALRAPSGVWSLLAKEADRIPWYIHAARQFPSGDV
jgi:hypothetical protein